MNNKKENEKKERIEISLPAGKQLLRHVLLVVAFAVFLFWVAEHPEKPLGIISNIFSLFTPFIIGFCVAYVVNLLMRPLERLWGIIWSRSKRTFHQSFKRPVCLILSALLVFGLVFSIVFMIIPALKDTVVSFVDRIPQYIAAIESTYNRLAEFLAEYNFELPDISVEMDKLGSSIKKLITSYGDSVVNTTVSVTASIVSVVVDIVLGIAFSLYVLAQKETLGRQFKKVLYALFDIKKSDRFLEIAALTDNVFTKFVTGQLTEAVIIGVLCFIGMLILGIPYATVISVLVGFTALIPVFGAFFGTAVGAFLILLESPVKALWFVVFIIVLQQLEGNLIYPRVVGKSVGLPGIWVLVAVTLGGGVMGVTGMLFAVPVVTVLYVIFKEYIAKRYNQKNIHRNQLKLDI